MRVPLLARRLHASLVPTAVTLVLLLATLAIGVAAAKVTLKRWRIAREIQSLEAEIHAFKNKQEELRAMLAQKDDPAALEQEARRRLTLSRKGEKVVILVPADEGQGTAVHDDNDDDNETNNDNDNNDDREEPNPVKWWNRFFGP